MTTLLATLAACLLCSTSFAQSHWGVDGPCGTDPGHVQKAKVNGLDWIRAGVSGSVICPSKTNAPDWALLSNGDGTYGLQGLKVWNGMVSNIVLDSAWHPSDLTDDEIVPWLININIAGLKAFCDPTSSNYLSHVKHWQIFNEPWYDNGWIGYTGTWQYLNGRLMTYTGPQGSIWTNGWAGTATTNALVPQAFTWLIKMKQVIDGVAPTAHALGIMVWGPHWQSYGYVGLAICGRQMGLYDNVDVFCFGVMPDTEPGGEPFGPTGWATQASNMVVAAGCPQFAICELHLNNWTNDAPDYVRADQLRRGLTALRDMGMLTCIVHIGYQNWCGGCNDEVKTLSGYDSLGGLTLSMASVIQVLSSGGNGQSVVLDRLDAIGKKLDALKLPVFLPVTQQQLDDCVGMSTKSAHDIESKYQGRIIAP